MRCEALSFDLDGTVIDYSVSTMRALNAIGGSESDLPMWHEVSTRAEVALNGGTLPAGRFDHDRIGRFHEARSGRRLTEPEVSDLVAVRRRSVLDAVRLYPDAAQLLQSARALGLRCAAVSNSFAELREDIIQRLGLAQHFCRVTFCGDGDHRKPDAKAFTEVLDALGGPDARVVHIGDEFDTDVIGARNAGLRSIHVNRSGAGCEHTGDCVTSLAVTRERRTQMRFASGLRLITGGSRPSPHLDARRATAGGSARSDATRSARSEH